MHPTKLPQRLIEEAIQRRGSLHPLADFDTARAALVVIDMQNFFMDMVPAARSVVSNINRLAKSIRLGGGKVVWVQMTLDESDTQTWRHFFEKLLNAAKRSEHLAELARDSSGWQLDAGLTVANEDWRVEKRRFSALIQGSSDLEARLRERKIDTLLIAGTVTNVCCESTARDAMMLDFPTIMVADACAALDDESHLAALANFQTVFGDVLTVDEVLAGIDQTVTVRLDRAAL
jgi:ureidoacrylate peracid hydrolase